jgi:hypothetical protein
LFQSSSSIKAIDNYLRITVTQGVCNEESHVFFSEGRDGCNRHRIWTYRRRHLGCDHRRRAGSRNEAEYNFLIGLIRAQISWLEMKGLRPLAEAPFVEFQFVATAAIESRWKTGLGRHSRDSKPTAPATFAVAARTPAPMTPGSRLPKK